MLAADRMYAGERAPQRREISVSAQVQVFEHQKSFFPAFPLAKGRRDTRACHGKRRETVCLGGETVKLRAIVDFREEPAPTAFQDIGTVNAAPRGGDGALDAERTGGIRDCCLQRSDELR